MEDAVSSVVKPWWMSELCRMEKGKRAKVKGVDRLQCLAVPMVQFQWVFFEA